MSCWVNLAVILMGLIVRHETVHRDADQRAVPRDRTASRASCLPDKFCLNAPRSCSWGTTRSTKSSTHSGITVYARLNPSTPDCSAHSCICRATDAPEPTITAAAPPSAVACAHSPTVLLPPAWAAARIASVSIACCLIFRGVAGQILPGPTGHQRQRTFHRGIARIVAMLLLRETVRLVNDHAEQAEHFQIGSGPARFGGEASQGCLPFAASIERSYRR